MKSDIGMPCQKVTNKDLIVKVNIQGERTLQWMSINQHERLAPRRKITADEHQPA